MSDVLSCNKIVSFMLWCVVSSFKVKRLNNILRLKIFEDLWQLNLAALNSNNNQDEIYPRTQNVIRTDTCVFIIVWITFDSIYIYIHWLPHTVERRPAEFDTNVCTRCIGVQIVVEVQESSHHKENIWHVI